MSTEWEIERLDLATYLDRIGEQPGPPTGATLHRLHRAHVDSIPFENLDILLGYGISVALDSVQDKLVRRRRGGYCYEHGVLFAAVLERLGFGVGRLLARIGYDAERPRPRTHMTLHVQGDDGEWLADVGFGAGLAVPIPWNEAGPQDQDGWSYRIVDDGANRQLQEAEGEGWSPLYTFTTERQHVADVEMANHFTSTHPSSPFIGQLIAMRRHRSSRTRLRGRRLEVSYPGGAPEVTDLDDAAVGAVLRDTFDIALDDAEVAALGLRAAPNR